MSHRFVTLRRTTLAFVGLLSALPGLRAQALAPVATPLRAYDKGFREPVRLATDFQGRLYVADPRLGLVTVRDERGHLLAVKRGFSRPLGVAVDPSGRIFVCEAGKGRVSIFTPGWVPSGALGQGDGEFLLPNHLQITADGQVWVVDSAANQVKVYGPDGLMARQFGTPGNLPGQFNFPTGLAVTPAGEVFVSDQGNERIQIFDAMGTFLRKFGGPIGMLGSNTTFGRVQGLMADPQGRIYLADSFRGIVTVVNPNGTPLGTIGTFGSGPGQLMGPVGLALDRNNRLFVATPGNTRVEVFGLDTYTDPHILTATLMVDPAELQRLTGSDHREDDEDRDRPDNQDHPKNHHEGAASQARGRRQEPMAQTRRPGLVSVLIKVPGVSPSAIQEAGLTGNGIPAARLPGAYIGDFDGDGNFEFRAWFDRRRLLATMPDGEAFLVVSGRLSDGRTFEGIAEVRVLTPLGGVQ